MFKIIIIIINMTIKQQLQSSEVVPKMKGSITTINRYYYKLQITKLRPIIINTTTIY